MRKAKITIFFDGACPICSHEIRFYKRKAGAVRCRWVDVNRLSEELLPSGYTRDDLLKRFHVDHPTEGITSGAMAFALLWQEMFNWRWIVRAMKVPIIGETFDFAYRAFLFLRQTFFRRVSCDVGIPGVR